MNKVLLAASAAGWFVAAIVASPSCARAASNGGVAADSVGGVTPGTTIGLSAHRLVYVAPAPGPAPVVGAPPPPPPGYVVYSGYRLRSPAACPGSGYWARKPVAFDRAGRPIAWSKPRWFCR